RQGPPLPAVAPGGQEAPAAALREALAGLGRVAPDQCRARLDALAGRPGPAAAALAAAAALPRAPVDMPGPTGESNRLSLHPRGRVLCLGAGGEVALAQAVQALAAGNSVLLVAE